MAAGPDSSFELTITGLPRWCLQGYLMALGAVVLEEGVLAGPGWQARLTQADDFVLGSVRVGQVHLALRGEAGAVEAARRALAPKLLRGGG